MSLHSNYRRYEKAAIVCCLLIFAAAIFQTARSESLFPWIPAAVALSLLSVLAVSHRISTRAWVGLAAAIGSVYRATVYLWPPSYIGFDPDVVATAVNRVVAAGSIGAIHELGFYSQASLFHNLSAEVAIITGSSAQTAFVIYPLAFGILVPITAACLSRRLAPESYRHFAIGGGATLGAAGVMVWKFSYWPLPQVLAALLWGAALLLLFRAVANQSKTDILLVAFVTALLAVTHKLASLVIAATASASLVVFGATAIRKRRSPSRKPMRTMTSVALFTAIVLALQQLWLTTWARAIVLGILRPLSVSSAQPGAASIDYQLATPLQAGLLPSIEANIGWIVLTGTAALATVVIWWRQPDDAGITAVGASGTFGLLLAFSVAAPTVSTQRILLFAEWIFIPATVGGICWVLWTLSQTSLPQRFSQQKLAKTLLGIAFVGCLGVLLVTQVATVTMVPDHPKEPRLYLTENEIEAKATIVGYATDDVHMDAFYAHEYTPIQTTKPSTPYRTGQATASPGAAPMRASLLNGTFSDADYFVIRPGVDRVLGPTGGYRLQYNPAVRLSQASSHHRAYSSGEVILFSPTNKSE